MTEQLPEEFIEIRQGSYWRAVEDTPVRDITERNYQPIVIPAGQVLLLQSIRDVDDQAHTIILRPHPADWEKPIYIVNSWDEDGTPSGWTYGDLTEYRFLVADFLRKFVLEEKAEQVRSKELAAAEEHVRQLQQKLIKGQNDEEVLRPVLALGISQWEKEQKLDPSAASEIATMSTSTALVPTLTGEHVEKLKLRAEREYRLATIRATWIKERVAEVGDAVKSLVPYMEEHAAAALSQTEDIIRKVSSIQKTIETLDLYIGKGVEVETLATGASAPADLPLTVAQRKLYMQEEFAVWAEVQEGFDFRDEKQFLHELARNESFRRQIFPSERSIVCMAVRRNEKKYEDPWSSVIKNEINREVFLLVRDGENLYRVFSPVESHLRALQLFPSRDETDAIFTGADGSNIDFMDVRYTDRLEKHKLTALHYKRFLVLLAGLDHRLNLFGTFYGGPKTQRFVSAEFQRQNFRFIHDADGLGMLPTPDRQPLDEFIKEKNTYLRSGSRLMCDWNVLANPRTAPGMAKGNPSDRYSSYYSYSRTPQRWREITIAFESQGELVVNCETYPTFGSSDKIQKSRVSLSAWTEGYYKKGFGYLVLDAIKADELEAYIYDRDEREDFIAYIGLFKAAVTHLREVEKQEAKARAALLAALDAGDIGQPDTRGALIDAAVRGWRALHRGADLPGETSGKAFTDLLNTMYTIASSETLKAKALKLLTDDAVQPLRLIVTGANKLALYVTPKPEERDDRIVPHVWARRLSLDVKKDGDLKLVDQRWVSLGEKSAAETTLFEWLGVEALTPLISNPYASSRGKPLNPFGTFERKQELFNLIERRNVVSDPWLVASASEAEWEGLFEQWSALHRRNSLKSRIVESVRILFPVGLSVHLEKNQVKVICLMHHNLHARLWHLATTPEQKQRVEDTFVSQYRDKTHGRDAFRAATRRRTRNLTFIKTREYVRFPEPEWEYGSLPLLSPGDKNEQAGDSLSLDALYRQALDYNQRYDVRGQELIRVLTLGAGLEGNLDVIFSNFIGKDTPLSAVERTSSVG